MHPGRLAPSLALGWGRCRSEVVEVVAEEAPVAEPELVAIDTAEIAEDD